MKKEPKFKNPKDAEMWRLTNRVMKIEEDLMHFNEAWTDLLSRLDSYGKDINNLDVDVINLEGFKKVQIKFNKGTAALLKSLTKKEVKQKQKQVKQEKKQGSVEKLLKYLLRRIK